MFHLVCGVEMEVVPVQIGAKLDPLLLAFQLLTPHWIGTLAAGHAPHKTRQARHYGVKRRINTGALCHLAACENECTEREPGGFNIC